MIKFFLLVVASISVASAMTVEKVDRLTKAQKCDAVVEATFIGSRVVRDKGRLSTLFKFQTRDEIKGTSPEFFEVKVRGGASATEVHLYEGFPSLQENEDYTLFLVVDERDNLRFHNLNQGAEKVNRNPHRAALDPVKRNRRNFKKGRNLRAFSAPESAAIEEEEGTFTAAMNNTDGLLVSSGTPFRYILADRGSPIPVIPDTSTLPAGITEAQALSALQNALDAWEDNTSVMFSLQSPQTLSKSADLFNSAEGMVIRVQFHDNFNDIANNSTTLGIGGSGFSTTDGSGGRLGSQDTYRSNYGYVILEHTKALLSDPDFLEEVLCHEVGHVIGLAHSSEDSNESDPLLLNSVMYYSTGGSSSNGAAVNQYDIDTSLKLYPLNTPPYGFDRLLRVVTSPNALTNPEVNQLEIMGGDLQGTSTTFTVTGSTTNSGTFSVSGNTVTFTPAEYYGDSGVGNYSPGSYFGLLTGYYSDGVNRSPIIRVSVIELYQDSNSDGLPDSWVNTHFPGTTPGFHADPDGDGLENWEEFRLGSDPNDDADGIPKVTIDPTTNGISLSNPAYTAIYTLESSDNLGTFSDLLYLQDLSGADVSVNALYDPAVDDRRFFRIKLRGF